MKNARLAGCVGYTVSDAPRSLAALRLLDMSRECAGCFALVARAERCRYA